MSGPFPPALDRAVRQHPYPLLFATVSGAHLYGFASADSDWDLRGVHLLPARELRDLARACVTVHHVHHYLGFSADQWEKVSGSPEPRVKPLLYTFRTLLTGIHLMRSGEVEANLGVLNGHFRLAYLDDLITLKRDGAENEPLRGDLAFFAQEYLRLRGELKAAREQSGLPQVVAPQTTAALSDLLVRLRDVAA